MPESLSQILPGLLRRAATPQQSGHRFSRVRAIPIEQEIAEKFLDLTVIKDTQDLLVVFDTELAKEMDIQG